MTFSESVTTCFRKTFNIEGRASRSEYWWFKLFCLSVCASLILISFWGNTSRHAPPFMVVYMMLGIVLLGAYIGVTTRRLHDINLSGWWYAVYCVALIISFIVDTEIGLLLYIIGEIPMLLPGREGSVDSIYKGQIQRLLFAPLGENKFGYEEKSKIPLEINFSQSIISCIKKLKDFSGKASFAEFWWFIFFTHLFVALASLLDIYTSTFEPIGLFVVSAIALIWLPNFAVTIRLLNKMEFYRDGEWRLLAIIPLPFLLLFKDDDSPLAIIFTEDMAVAIGVFFFFSSIIGYYLDNFGSEYRDKIFNLLNIGMALGAASVISGLVIIENEINIIYDANLLGMVCVKFGTLTVIAGIILKMVMRGYMKDRDSEKN